MIYVISNYMKGGNFNAFSKRILNKYVSHDPRDYGNLGTRLHASLALEDQEAFDSPRFRQLAAYVHGESTFGLERDCWDSVKMITGMSLSAHDDTNNERKVAFTFYYHPKWSESNGGELVFNQTPEVVVTPAPNLLVLFKVSKKTLHSVLPIEGPRVRRSITGWLK